MNTTIATINLPKEVAQALDELAETISLPREEALRIATMRTLRL